MAIWNKLHRINLSSLQRDFSFSVIFFFSLQMGFQVTECYTILFEIVFSRLFVPTMYDKLIKVDNKKKVPKKRETTRKMQRISNRHWHYSELVFLFSILSLYTQDCLICAGALFVINYSNCNSLAATRMWGRFSVFVHW